MPHVDLDIRGLHKSFGPVTALVGASLSVQRGEIVSILGPSGCGKSTLLHLLAGHLRPDAGTIEIDGRRMAGDGAFVQPHGRDVGMVFQDYALFPHMTVAANVGFAIRARRWRARAERDARVRDLLEQFRIGDLAARYPQELSGGQQQRVAIARAIAQRPRVLLLDEPFSNLDSSTREHVRGEIVELLRETGLTCVFVTHDQEEALSISDRVAVMQAGRIAQVDDPQTLYRRPLCLEVAEFLGKTNVLPGRASGRFVDTEVGTFPLATDAEGDVQVLVRPELIDLRAADDGAATVVAREFRGHDVLYRLRLASGATVWAHRPSVHMASPGERVRVTAQPGFAAIATGPLDAQAGTFDDSHSAATSREPVRMTSHHNGSALVATSTSAGSAASG